MEEAANNIQSGPVKIDVGAVLKSRLGAKASRVPGFLVRGLERLIRQDELNDLLEYGWPRRGAEFCRAVVDRLDITVRAEGVDGYKANAPGRPLFVSNHPLGGLDGMVLIDLVATITGREPFFVVNDLLMAVEPLTDVFVPINKHGAQSKAASAALDRAMASDRPVIVFPAGMCSRRRGGKVADLEWQKMFVRKARQHGRTIVPTYFDAENSTLFYRMASLRERLGIKFNLEMVLLPGEVVKKRGANFTVTLGAPVDPMAVEDVRGETDLVRKAVYSLKGAAGRRPSNSSKNE